MIESDLSWLRIVFAFSVVLALMAALAYALKYVNAKGFRFTRNAPLKRRLQIVETLMLDTRRRCVLVRCDDHEHLLLLGGQNDIVIETNLSPQDPQNNP